MLKYPRIVQKIILMWIFTEAGLGGLMHLLHLPFTGFVVGGFSILLLVLLAKYSSCNLRIMLFSLGWVLLAKFSLSPQSPLGAYIAVAFQGLVGIGIFYFFKVNKTAIYFFSIIIMLENAFQKPIMATIIFGKEMWQGLLWTVENFSGVKNAGTDLLWGLFVIYTLIYLGWAIILAHWASSFLFTLEKYQFTHLEKENSPIAEKVFSKKKRWIQSVSILIVLSITAYFLFSYNRNVLSYLVRTAVMIILFNIIIPFVMRMILNTIEKRNVQSLLVTITY